MTSSHILHRVLPTVVQIQRQPFPPSGAGEKSRKIVRLSFERPGRQVWAFQGSFWLALFTGAWKFFCDVRDRNAFAQIWEILVGSGRRERSPLCLCHSWKYSMEDVRRCFSLALSNSALDARAAKPVLWFFILIRFRPWSNFRSVEMPV